MGNKRLGFSEVIRDNITKNSLFLTPCQPFIMLLCPKPYVFESQKDYPPTHLCIASIMNVPFSKIDQQDNDVKFIFQIICLLLRP